MNCVRDYLDDKKIEYDVVKISEAVTNQEEEVVIFTEAQIMPERECCIFESSKDRMTVTAVFYPPTEGAELMTEEEVLSSLAYRKIVYGIQKDVIHDFFEHRKYCTEIVVAQGKPVKQGQNARVEYHFNVNLRPKPALREDGSVDYHNLNLRVEFYSTLFKNRQTFVLFR